MTDLHAPTGGEFLLREIAPEQVFTPERLPAEARLIARTMEEFMRREVLPVIPRLEAQEPDLLPSLLRKAGGLGLLAGGTPAAYEGLELPKTTLALLAEKAAPYLSFAISIGVHTGVATLPLLFFGTEEQKAKHLPQLASGESIGAFALSEANSGSDALGARTRAVLSADGTHYLLTGEKLWTTNGGFADLFTVFAKVDGERFTAFLVEKETPGLILGREERKMGLHGSSTRRILLQGAQVPVANILGEVGKGHRPALYALNIGRFNIGVTALGAAKECLRLATRYAQERIQFGHPIARFDLIRHKLSEMATRIYLLESMIYRLAGYWDGLESASSPTPTPDTQPPMPIPLLQASEEYAIECAIIKFFGTEVLNYVADEALQIHGGFGYSEEFAVERMYRDARVFRIFEGSNEINRLTVLDQLLRRIASGRLVLPSGESPPAALADAPADQALNAMALDEVGQQVTLLRRLIQEIVQAGRERQDQRIGQNQCFAAAVADLIALLFALESAWLRAIQAKNGTDEAAPERKAESYGSAVVIVAATEMRIRAEELTRAAMAALQTEDRITALPAALRDLSHLPTTNTLPLRWKIVDYDR